MKKANCPACGGEVSFLSDSSVEAVCKYCHSTLLRNGEHLKNIGKMSSVNEDASPIQIGTSGTYQKQRFNVIGRIQVSYDAGFWNEWFVIFDSGKLGWLSDSSGQYSILFSSEIKSGHIPDFEHLSPGKNITVNNIEWTVTDHRLAKVIGGEGELPMKILGGYHLPSTDLRSDDLFATIDYSHKENEFYMGTSASFDEFSFQNLKDEKTHQEQIQTIKDKIVLFDCASCGASLRYHSGISSHVICKKCNSVNDVSLKVPTVSETLKQQSITPTLKIGLTGIINNKKYEIIGFLHKFADEDEWEEYLLYNIKQGYLWMSHYNGEWEIIEVLNSGIKEINMQGTCLYKNETYLFDSHSEATTDYVLGEFNWKVTSGERTGVTSYKHGTKTLYKETTKNEITWSSSKKVSKSTIQTIFKVEHLPSPASATSLSSDIQNLVETGDIGEYIANLGSDLTEPPFNANGNDEHLKYILILFGAGLGLVWLIQSYYWSEHGIVFPGILASIAIIYAAIKTMSKTT